MGLASDAAIGLTSCAFMGFMRPTSKTTVKMNRCRRCHQYDGYTRVEPVEENPTIDVFFPGEDEADPLENMQSLVNDYFINTKLVDCGNPDCSSRVSLETKREVVDAKEAIVINLSRLRKNPEADCRGIEDEAEKARRAALPLLKDNRPVTISHMLFIPTESGSPAMYSLCATVQHMGSTNSGHYVAHLRVEEDDSWFIANDRLPLTQQKCDPRIDRQCSSIFIYRRYRNDPATSNEAPPSMDEELYGFNVEDSDIHGDISGSTLDDDNDQNEQMYV